MSALSLRTLLAGLVEAPDVAVRGLSLDSRGVQQGDTKLIAQQLREMKAIWEHRGLNGLVRRREAEAHLVEKAV